MAFMSCILNLKEPNENKYWTKIIIKTFGRFKRCGISIVTTCNVTLDEWGLKHFKQHNHGQHALLLLKAPITSKTT